MDTTTQKTSYTKHIHNSVCAHVLTLFSVFEAQLHKINHTLKCFTEVLQKENRILKSKTWQTANRSAKIFTSVNDSRLTFIALKA